MKIEWTFTVNEPWTLDRVLNFVTIANRYTCNIYVGKSGRMLNAKGLLGIVSFSLSLGDHGAIVLQLDGSDAEAAFEQVAVYLQTTNETVRSLYPKSS
ncbi:HPr family phosphocarrier protein [Paenibacillus sp. SI8]|uniref:HPr family phosphocarrier protein n=1 Tax=unclassified Paenibacillus TaxID=185978 RepID=UPI0034661FB3